MTDIYDDNTGPLAIMDLEGLVDVHPSYKEAKFGVPGTAKVGWVNLTDAEKAATTRAHKMLFPNRFTTEAECSNDQSSS